ncbi:helix-turn-helix transcriptional regulator [Streptomyces longispororuber]|uniref:helix-turn-helix transcriptional regulator n=1 Tax=Streptomyces longispororuber TaxID=68230 RepID=UPI002109AF4C|nr:helix-turn-helix transcriptional regulator [Streptomyces longispororuber]MCQ4210317.1 helix-turn-helix transcriptional regulator [Streptomyces longispororuber]
MDDLGDLGAFLQSRRARVEPASVGVTVGARRRVSGLRREELAQLAGVSVDYYTRLEQGRATQPSEQVLDALSRALRLDDAARGHLHRLARLRHHRPPPSHYPTEIRPQLRQVLAALDAFPALVLNHRMDVVAYNRPAGLLYGDLDTVPAAERNLARAVFLDGGRGHVYVDLDACRADTVSHLRHAAGEFAGDPELAALIGELSIGSRRFSELWGAADVGVRSHGPKRFRHPMIGEITLHQERFVLPDGSGQELLTLTAEPGGTDEDNLRLLANLDG